MNKAHEDINWVNYPLTDTALNASNLNKMDRSIDVIDDRVVAMDTTKANTTDMLQAFIDVDIDDTTGTLTFTKKNGTTVTLNTNLNKIATNMRYDADPSSATYQKLILTYNTTPVTYGYIDLTALITQYEFTDSSIIHFSVTSGKVSATIIDGSITAEKLQPNFLADCQSAKNDAESAQQGANQNALVSEGWAKGTQNGIAVTSQSPYYHNNAEWFKDQAQEIAGGSLAGLSDTLIDSPTQGQVLTYDEVSEVWINSNPSAGILPHLHILTESDATVTIAGLTPTQTSAGVWDVDIPSYGTYLVQSVNSSGTQNVSVVVDTCKIYDVSAYHFNATITVTFPGSATCTCSKSGVTYTATTTPYTFNVNSAGNWMISITEDGQTVAQNVEITTTGQTETLTLDFAYIALTIPSELIGQTVTITDGTSTRTWVSSATTHTFVCILGNYTLSIGGYSTSVNVVAYTTYTASIETWGYKGWLASAGIADTFGSLDNLIADQPTIRTLMTKHVSADYLYNWYTHDSSILSTILSNTNTVKWFGLRDYVCDKFMANATAKTAILASTNWAYILKDKVPIMTSYTAPYGSAWSGSDASGNPAWHAYDNNSNTWWSANANTLTHIGYSFECPILVQCATVKVYKANPSATYKPLKVTLQGSNDKSTWTDLCDTTNLSYTTDFEELTINVTKNANYYLHYRIVYADYNISAGGSSYCNLKELQFYGRALNSLVTTMTGNTTPSGEVLYSTQYDTSTYAGWKAFDKNASTEWASSSGSYSNQYIGYDFKRSVKILGFSIQNTPQGSYASSYPFKNFKLQAYNNNAWEDIESYTNPSGANVKTTYVLDDPIESEKFRIFGNAYGTTLVSCAELQFFGVDYSEHTERHWIYDNGIELETISEQTLTGGTVTKNADDVYTQCNGTSNNIACIQGGETLGHTLLRATIGDQYYTSVSSGFVIYVSPKSSFSTSAYRQMPQSGINPYTDCYLDISAYTSDDTKTCGIGLMNSTNGYVKIKELWVE